MYYSREVLCQGLYTRYDVKKYLLQRIFITSIEKIGLDWISFLRYQIYRVNETNQGNVSMHYQFLIKNFYNCAVIAE